MSVLDHQLRLFRARLLARLAGYSALWGLCCVVAVLVAAPWLREYAGWPDYDWSFWLPLVLPVLMGGLALVLRPDMRTTVLLADAWHGNSGAIVSAWELQHSAPDSPFTAPVAAKAAGAMQENRFREPRLLWRLLMALVVLILLMPLSRWVHAQMDEKQRKEDEQQAAQKLDVPPEVADKLAQDAGKSAEEAKKASARQQETLADDIERAARDAQAGGGDKERALREANSLVERAHGQTEGQQGRDAARDELARNEATRELAEALESVDPERVEKAIRDLAKSAYNEKGELDPEKAKQIRDAVDAARKEAPGDQQLRRAADALERALSEKAIKDAGNSREKLRSEMTAQGKTPEEIEKALQQAGQLDKEALAKALEEMARSASPLRDLDPSGRQAQELLRKLESGEISPEQAQAMIEAARELSQRLELDAETLREMLKQGRKFEGLDKAAEEVIRRAGQEGRKITPGEMPEWGDPKIPEEWRKAAEAEARARRERTGEGRPGREGEGGRGTPGGGTGTEGDGGPGGTGNGHSREVATPGTEGGVDTTDTGQGGKDPNGKPEELDPTKAGHERATREAGTRSGSSGGLNTRDEEEQLPRRFRDAARKYFER
ncbi:MAG: hypothetical protein IT463_08100 [Planctomycetes bacterium]|nr:hypothetical protein [Planctomycetota bacterium]